MTSKAKINKATSKVKNKSSQDKKEKDKKNEVAVIEVPKDRYVKPKTGSSIKAGIEVYKTDEENYSPYVSSFNNASIEVKDEDEEDDSSSSSEKKGFNLHMGEILETEYIVTFQSIGFESDYTEMSNAGSIKIDEVDLKKFYKGIRLKLLSEWEAEDETLNWLDLKQSLLGFITEQTFQYGNVDIKLSGFTKVLEENYKFEFSQMKRSEILREVILTAGMKPFINVEGLDDDVTDFTNVSSSGSSGDDSGDISSTGSASIDEAVKKAIKGVSDPLGKAKAIDKAFKSHIYYSYYYDCHHSNIDSAWKNGHLNCADGANVLCAMFIAGGLKAVILHTPNHYIVKVTVNGKAYYTDNAASSGSHTSRPFGQVWRGITSGSVVGTKIGM